MMAKRGGPVSPYGDAFAAEFDAAETLEIMIEQSCANLVGITLDGVDVPVLHQTRYVEVLQGHHVVTWLFNKTRLDNTTITAGVDARHQVDGKIYNKQAFFPANLEGADWYYQFRTNPFYATGKLFCYAKIPPELVADSPFFIGGIGEIHVPKGTAEAYKAATVWSRYTNKIIDDL